MICDMIARELGCVREKVSWCVERAIVRREVGIGVMGYLAYYLSLYLLKRGGGIRECPRQRLE